MDLKKQLKEKQKQLKASKQEVTNLKNLDRKLNIVAENLEKIQFSSGLSSGPSNKSQQK